MSRLFTHVAVEVVALLKPSHRRSSHGAKRRRNHPTFPGIVVGGSNSEDYAYERGTCVYGYEPRTTVDRYDCGALT